MKFDIFFIRIITISNDKDWFIVSYLADLKLIKILYVCYTKTDYQTYDGI